MIKKRILWLSDGPNLVTGYATISRKLLNYLAERGWECHYLAHTMQTQTLKPGITLEDNEEFKFWVHGAGIRPYCADILQHRIREIKPDVVGILLDTFMVHPNNCGGDPWFLNLDFRPAKSVFYFPSDGGRFPLGCDLILKKVDYPVAMSKFAQEQVKKEFNLNVNYIPHAVEPSVYYPFNETEKEQNKMKYGLKGKFVIGVVARNQGRKMLDRTLLTMEKVAKQIPEAVLLMHCDKNDPAGYFNMDVEINRLNLNNRVVFTGMRYFKGFDYKKMNEIYNLMDVFFLGTSGEGFGVPIIEAMACGAPAAVTDYTTTKELVSDTMSGEAVKVKEEIHGNWHVPRALIDTEDAAEKIIKLYKNPELRKKYGENGRNAILKDYNWEKIAEQWHELLVKISDDEKVS